MPRQPSEPTTADVGAAFWAGTLDQFDYPLTLPMPWGGEQTYESAEEMEGACAGAWDSGVG